MNPVILFALAAPVLALVALTAFGTFLSRRDVKNYRPTSSDEVVVRTEAEVIRSMEATRSLQAVVTRQIEDLARLAEKTRDDVK